MNRLPYEIQTTIWNHYYSTMFHKNILGQFRHIEQLFHEMDTFLKNEFYPNKGREYDKDIAYMLRQYNDFLCHLFHHDRGSYLYMNAKKMISLCFDEKYLSAGFRLIAAPYQQICVYCLVHGVPYMSYYTMERFNLLSKNMIK